MKTFKTIAISAALLAVFTPKIYAQSKAELEAKVRQFNENVAKVRRLTEQGQYREAILIMEKVVEVFEVYANADPVKYADFLLYLAGLYADTAAYEKAEPLIMQATEIFGKALGKTHASYAYSLNSLGLLYYRMGAYEKAESLILQALKIRRDIFGENHVDCATSLNNLASLYMLMHDYKKAEPLYVRVNEILGKVLGKNNSTYASSLNNLAALYTKTGADEKAEHLYEEALKILREVLGEKHPLYASSLNNLACLYADIGRFGEAEKIYLQAMELRGKTYGKKHPAYAISLGNLGYLYERMGADINAEPFFLKARNIQGEILGKRHPDYAVSLELLAFNQFLLNKPKEALSCATEVESRYRELWKTLLSFTSENQREAAIQTVGNLSLCGTLRDGQLSASSLLWRKGALLDSLLEERRLALAAGADKALAKQFANAEKLKRMIQQAIMDNSKATLSDNRLAECRAELEALQKAMALKVAGLGAASRSLECSVVQVQAAIPSGTVLVDFLRYGHALSNGKREDRYAAVLVMPDKDPAFVPLGKADRIETELARHCKLVGGSPAAGETSARDTELEDACKDLHKLIGAPIEAALPQGTIELILCPDGQLHFLAFSSLMNPDGQLWAEKFTLRNISTARDLLKLPSSRKAGSNQTVVLVGNPDFRESTPLALVAEAEDARDREERERLAFNLTRSGQNEEMRGLSFRALQGTAVEVAGLRTRFEKQGWKTTLLTGPEASETAVVAAVTRPDILHLATHGFFVDELDLGQKKASERQAMNVGMGGDNLRQHAAARDPMLRSGLALSGAQSTRSLWESGKIPPLDKDGILTAAEVASLRLLGTRLVTLSACETGLGESKSGEGVLGLQRAIALAGAENLLMTLWSIDDADTIALMAAFYDRVLAGEHPARALPAVQREALVRLRAGHGLWHAINRAAPFVIVSNTAIPAALKN